MGHGTAGSSELFAAWSAWCKDEGEEPGNQTSFGLALINRGFDSYTSNGRKRWRSLGLTSDDAEGSRG
jgi:phage/plasmid-associated DNA primase